MCSVFDESLSLIISIYMTLLLRVLFSVVFMMLLQVYLAEPLPRTANYSYANKCILEKELLMMVTSRDDDSLFGKEIREAYPNNLLNLNDLKLSDVTKVLARRNERIFWINLSDHNKDKIWFRELLKQKRNRFKDKCLVVLHMWTYVVVVFVRYIIVRHRSPPSSMP